MHVMLPNGTREAIDGADYPMTTEELIERCGESQLSIPDGSERVCDALERIASETFQTPEDARFAVYTGVSRAAIGRTGYSDRDPAPPGSPHGPDEVSF